jgi:cysteinyl-tRNA synthetase
VCGPTVYDRAHLGNARPVVVFDVLYRLLRHVYGAQAVTYVRNFTDVDDKINARAREIQARNGGDLNAIIRILTDETIGWYHADMDALGALRPTHEPRATEFIVQMVAMIETLTKRISPTTNRPYAYPEQGHVLFDVHSYPDYGKLSGRSLDDMIAGARVEVAPYKRDPMDFVLWKPSADDEPGWDSPWGRGRPGWHIECSAMSHELLGPAFDIHGGGIDLQFPHHENEIAQSCCAHPDAGFANVWLHNEMVQVEGKKMSKSLGNFFTVRDLLEQGWPGEVIRFVMLSTHYRKPMDWTRKMAMDAQMAISEMAGMLGVRGADGLRDLKSGNPLPEVVEALGDDLNTHLALSLLRKKAYSGRYTVSERIDQLEDLYASQLLLGFDLKEHAMALEKSGNIDKLKEVIDNELIATRVRATIEALDHARAEKRFSEADRLRALLGAAGVQVKSGKEGSTFELLPNFDPSKLDALK